MNFSQLGLLALLFVMAKVPASKPPFVAGYEDALGREVESLIKEDLFYTTTGLRPVPPIKVHFKVDVLTSDDFPDPARVVYIRNWWKVAVSQRRAHGVPAAIALAQGILESNAGRSNLAVQTNNHFGIKCWLWKKGECGKGHCFQYHDDHPSDRFRKYETADESWEAHSAFLLRPNYEECFEIPIKDYKGWSACLKRRGYATDPKYAKKLNRIINDYKLYQFENL